MGETHDRGEALRLKLASSRDSRKRVPAELRAEAVAFAKAERALGQRYKAIATALGVKAETLMRWCRRSPEPKFARIVVKPAASDGARPGGDTHRAAEHPAGRRAVRGAVVFGLSPALAVWMHTEPTDMRKSFNTLSALVTEEMRREVLSGDLFVFISRDRKRAKVLQFDGTGLITWHDLTRGVRTTARIMKGSESSYPSPEKSGHTSCARRSSCTLKSCV